MTRYTKLEGRRTIDNGARPITAICTQENNSNAVVMDTPMREDPKKLLKRAKLLRLKAKKASSDETRAKFEREIKEVEIQVNASNGARGSLGKRKKQNNETSRSWRPRLGDQSSEFRRARRADERTSSTRCFVCRGMGHSAKECSEHVAGEGATAGRDTVGICFRCGSTEHTLSKCRRGSKRDDHLPFATCYICSTKGHLSSKCPENMGRGVYPEGGSCKVCKSVEHLAKDCPLDPRRVSSAGAIDAGGVGILAADADVQIGADEDEFHTVAQARARHTPRPAAACKPRKKVVSF
ncbi:hypothetical protein MVES1_001163 [Malassezia vespertilionis]|uniref:uncharacterized protein n=1 Tax=Malassezia vespertilionis TaxID=2020962 RepID=UPI0024B0BCF6|nr:uncharacterized protein MVES1_001163 [Malassezia vespertilionis]WFD05829.1 hypothetical protein MVES1_001163 [Malassezia vespertilionis]